MSKNIIYFNAVYYFLVIIFFARAKYDPSSSLGYGIFIIWIWIIAGISLAIMLFKKIISFKTTLDKIGVFIATPIPILTCLLVFFSFRDVGESEWYFNTSRYKYKVQTFSEHFTGNRRIEYYRSVDPINEKGEVMNDRWMKDSVWVYLSKHGDTVKKVRYRDGTVVE